MIIATKDRAAAVGSVKELLGEFASICVGMMEKGMPKELLIAAMDAAEDVANGTSRGINGKYVFDITIDQIMAIRRSEENRRAGNDTNGQRD